MFGTLKGRFLVIILILVACGWALFDNYRECRSQAADEPRTCSPIKLGLDLQGGMHLALEVADPEGTLTPEAQADATDRALKIIRTRIDEFGVAEPLIQKVGSDRIIVELPGIREEGAGEGNHPADGLPGVAAGQGRAGVQFRVAADGSGDRRFARARRAKEKRRRTRRPRSRSARRSSSSSSSSGTRPPRRTRPTRRRVETAPSRRPLTALLLDSGDEHSFLVTEADVPKVTRYLDMPEVQRLDAARRHDALGIGARGAGRPALPQRCTFSRAARS